MEGFAQQWGSFLVSGKQFCPSTGGPRTVVDCHIVVSIRFMIDDMESTEFTARRRIFLLQPANFSEHNASWKIMPFILINVCMI
jgi:hypothetical protein